MSDSNPDAGAFRFEMVCEAIAPDGTRIRVGAYGIPGVCLTCGGSVINDDYTSATANMDGTTMATVDNRPGLLCAACTVAHQRRARGGVR